MADTENTRAPAGDAQHAAWLADKIVALGDYAKEAAEMLRRWPAPASAPLPLTDARIDAIFDEHQDAPTMSYRYLVARSIERECRGTPAAGEPLPQRKNVSAEGTLTDHYNEGWNDCLDALAGPSHQAAPSEQTAADRDQRIFAAGWRTAANWMERDDLISDIGSPAYLKDMAAALSSGEVDGSDTRGKNG